MKEDVLKDDDPIVELLEEISENKNGALETLKKYGSSEENESFQYENTSSTPTIEFDVKVSEFVSKTETGWSCTECSYSAKSKTHVKDHAEKHVEGFSHECKTCHKTFSMKRSLRHHMRNVHFVSKFKQILAGRSI